VASPIVAKDLLFANFQHVNQSGSNAYDAENNLKSDKMKVLPNANTFKVQLFLLWLVLCYLE
jgi:hypothetical protein